MDKIGDDEVEIELDKVDTIDQVIDVWEIDDDIIVVDCVTGLEVVLAGVDVPVNEKLVISIYPGASV